jgi:hypothetical protein
MYEGIHVDSISGDQPNSARTAAVDNFRAGKTWVLIATDLIGRGEPPHQLRQTHACCQPASANDVAMAGKVCTRSLHK